MPGSSLQPVKSLIVLGSCLFSYDDFLWKVHSLKQINFCQVLFTGLPEISGQSFLKCSSDVGLS